MDTWKPRERLQARLVERFDNLNFPNGAESLRKQHDEAGTLPAGLDQSVNETRHHR